MIAFAIHAQSLDTVVTHRRRWGVGRVNRARHTVEASRHLASLQGGVRSMQMCSKHQQPAMGKGALHGRLAHGGGALRIHLLRT